MGVRIRAFQTSCEPLPRPTAIKTIAKKLQPCDTAAVDIACLPEGYLTGYASDAQTIADYAVAMDSTFFKSFLDMCSAFDTTLIVGFLEAIPNGYANAAAVIHRGKLLGCYRKIHPNEKAFTPGTQLPIFKLSDVSFGVNICYDANFSAPAFTLASQGAQVIFYPLNNLMQRETAELWRKKSPENLRQRAQEAGCWVVSADVSGSCGARISYGCTQIVAPDGSLIAAVAEGRCGFVTAELELSSLRYVTPT